MDKTFKDEAKLSSITIRHCAQMRSWFVYIVECSDQSLYTGITNDIEKRIITHNKGKGSKAVVGKRPVILVYSEIYKNKIEAARREFEIKSWKREKKLQLINTGG